MCKIYPELIKEHRIEECRLKILNEILIILILLII